MIKQIKGNEKARYIEICLCPNRFFLDGTEIRKEGFIPCFLKVKTNSVIITI